MCTRATLALLAVIAGSCVAPAAHARPDPGERAPAAEVTAGGVAERPRPTGPAEHVSPYPSQGSGGSVASRPQPDAARPVAAFTGAGTGFDWLAAGLGALTAGAAAVLVAAGIELRRRARRLPAAGVRLPQAR